MAIIADEITEKIKKYLKMVSDSGVHIERVIFIWFLRKRDSKQME